MKSKSISNRIFHFSLTKIVIGLFVCVGIVSLGQIGIGKLLEISSIDKDFKKLVVVIVTAVLAIASYSALFKFYDKRRITEFSKEGILKNITGGILLGFVLQALTIGVIYLKGGYSIQSINPILFIVPPFTMALSSAIFEETLVRGIIFRIIEEKLGSYFALIISAILFGILHFANPNSSLIAGIGLAIQAGLLLAAAFIYSRNLWFPIAIHFAWNFAQSAIFGAKVSGNTIAKTLLTSKIEGATWFTGGEFGPEGSIQATLFCLIATAILLILGHKKGNIIKPSWKQKRQTYVED